MDARSGTNAAPGARRHVGVFTFPAYAHIAPAVPMLAELVRRGHRVTCFVADRFADLVRGAGAEAVVYESGFPWYAGPAESPLRTMLDFFEESSAPMAAAVARFAGDRPDVLAHDLAASETARLLARKWDLPLVQLCPTIASSPTFSMSQRQDREACESAPEPIDPQDPAIARFIEHRERLLAESGLDGVSIEGFGAEYGHNIVFLPKAFQIAPEAFDDRFAFIGPCLSEPDPTAATAADEWTPPDDGRRVALVSLGSSYSPDQGGCLRRCVEALADSPWHVVVTLSHRVGLEELGPLPANVEAHQWLRHPEVLRHAAAFVTHAGMGSVMESLYYGVPMVLVPYHVDQRVISGQVADLNLGRVLNRGDALATELLATIAEVADSPRIRAAMTRMQRQVREAGGAARGADFIESLIRSEPTAAQASHGRPTGVVKA